MRTLRGVADALTQRLTAIFLRDGNRHKPVFGNLQDDAFWRDRLLFFEYFHGDTGAGLGASHQTGWTAYIANLLDHRYHVVDPALNDTTANHEQ